MFVKPQGPTRGNGISPRERPPDFRSLHDVGRVDPSMASLLVFAILMIGTAPAQTDSKPDAKPKSKAKTKGKPAASTTVATKSEEDESCAADVVRRPEEIHTTGRLGQLRQRDGAIRIREIHTDHDASRAIRIEIDRHAKKTASGVVGHHAKARRNLGPFVPPTERQRPVSRR